MRQQSSLLQGYRELANTKEYRERDWISGEPSSAGEMMSFWAEASSWFKGQGSSEGLVSPSFMHFRTLRDALGVLIFTDIREDACGPRSTRGKGLAIDILGSCVAFQRELREAEFRPAAISIFQKFFDRADRLWQDEEGDWVENVIDEFVVNKVYGCQVIVTNSTPNPCELDVLGEIPEGAIPVNTIEYSKTQNMVVQSYTT